MISPTDPLVKVKVGGKAMDFLLDSGATHSVLNKYQGTLTPDGVPVIGATGNKCFQYFTPPQKCSIGNRELCHRFLVMPDCPISLLGRDLLCKLQAQISFDQTKIEIHLPAETAWRFQTVLIDGSGDKESTTLPSAVRDQVYPLVWSDGIPGRARYAPPVVIKVKAGVTLPRLPQYYLKKEARDGIAPLIEKVGFQAPRGGLDLEQRKKEKRKLN